MSPPTATADLLNLLETAAHQLGVVVRREPLLADDDYARRVGGVCRIRGRVVAFIDPDSPIASQCAVLGAALRRCDLESHYLPPAVRAYVEALPDP